MPEIPDLPTLQRDAIDRMAETDAKALEWLNRIRAAESNPYAIITMLTEMIVLASFEQPLPEVLELAKTLAQVLVIRNTPRYLDAQLQRNSNPKVN